jgi:hypothetical protein
VGTLSPPPLIGVGLAYQLQISVQPKFGLYQEPKPRSNFGIGIGAEAFFSTTDFFFQISHVFLLLMGI